MQPTSKIQRLVLGMLAATLLSALIACGNNSVSTNNPPPATQSGTVNMILSDASTEDWAVIGVKVLGLSLIPQGGGTPVQVYTAPAPAPIINLVQLDQLGEILGNVSVPAGTYSGALLTIGANPGDVLLTASQDPEPGFAGTPGATIPSSQIQIMGAQGSSGSRTVPVSVNFALPLVVTANSNNALNLEVNLSHPAFIVAHVPPGAGVPLWAVNFNGPVHHRPVWAIDHLVLRHLYGTVTAVASDNSSITITKDYPVEPPTSPETAMASNQSLQIQADSTNGTIFYDVDARTVFTIRDFSSVSTSLPGKFVRVAARYQMNGSLTAVRIWASSTFNNIWVGPEGHVLHVDASNGIITVQNELGTGVPIMVNSNTEFFYRVPASALTDATPIGTGSSFLANIVRGFKVHVGVVDPLASPLVAQTVDIEIARFDGMISNSNSTNFTYTRLFSTSTDDYTKTLDYISSATPNGKDSNGNQIDGFKWWDFTFPTLAQFGSNAIANFVAATSGAAVNFGGSTSPISAWGISNATWNDPANPMGWAARWVVLAPSRIPLGTVATPWTPNSTGGSFGMTIPNGTNTVTVTLSSVSGSATLVYQVDDTNGIMTISPQDITTQTGLQNVSLNLGKTGTPVKCFGVPQPNGTLQAYVLLYFTGASTIQ